MGCNHAYKIPQADGKFFCLSCQTEVTAPKGLADRVESMPPVAFKLTRERWLSLRPKSWPYITLEMAVQAGWYLSFFGESEYVVMPVSRNGQQLTYSARIVDGDGDKYKSPYAVKKYHWISDESFSSPFVLFGEGIADGVALAEFGTGVGICGSYYDGTLNEKVRGKEVFIALDPDVPGVIAAARLFHDLLPYAANIHPVHLPADPPELTREDLHLVLVHHGYPPRGMV